MRKLGFQAMRVQRQTRWPSEPQFLLGKELERGHAKAVERMQAREHAKGQWPAEAACLKMEPTRHRSAAGREGQVSNSVQRRRVNVVVIVRVVLPRPWR